MQSNLRGALLSLAAFGAYATHDVLIKILGETFSPFQIDLLFGPDGLSPGHADADGRPDQWHADPAASLVDRPADGCGGVDRGDGVLSPFRTAAGELYAIFFAMPLSSR